MKLEKRACILCGMDKTLFLGRRMSPGRDPRLQTEIVRCSFCGLIYPNPMPHFEKGDIQDNFSDPANYFSQSAESRLKFFDKAMSEIERIAPGKGRVLDVGCGRGELLFAAEKRNWQATGTDISNSFVDYARRTFNVDALAGDLKDMDLPEESYDAATLISVIQYLPDPAGTLKKINASLKKGGILYIEVTNEDALVFKAGDLLESAIYGQKVTTRLSPLFSSYQLYGFNKSSLLAILGLTGFEICRIRTGGLRGGGRVGGRGLGNWVINLIRKVVILIGGAIGRGHLIFCIAKKREAK